MDNHCYKNMNGIEKKVLIKNLTFFHFGMNFAFYFYERRNFSNKRESLNLSLLLFSKDIKILIILIIVVKLTQIVLTG